MAQIRGRVDLGVGRAKNVAVAPHRAGTGGAARRRRSIPTRTSHRQRQCMRKRCQDRNRKTAKGATGDERAGYSVPRPIGGSDLEFFRSSARPEPAAYWPSGKRLISDVSANDCHWSFWVVKRANCVPHRREKDHHSERGCRLQGNGSPFPCIPSEHAMRIKPNWERDAPGPWRRCRKGGTTTCSAGTRVSIRLD